MPSRTSCWDWNMARCYRPVNPATIVGDLAEAHPDPSVRSPERTAETARTERRAQAIDGEFVQLTEWIRNFEAPIEAALAEFLLPKLETGSAGSLQFRQGQAASAFAKQNIDTRLTKTDGTRRSLFIRVADSPFDDSHRLLAYVAPDYSERERRELPRAERATFNLDLVAHGWAAPFVIYPSIPGALDLPLLIQAAATARVGGLGIWADEQTLLAYEYRAMEKLYRVTKKKVAGQRLDGGEEHSWRVRYCVDMRSRVLHGPEDYFGVDPEYRLWIWPQDLGDAVGRLNLTPAPKLVGAD